MNFPSGLFLSGFDLSDNTLKRVSSREPNAITAETKFYIGLRSSVMLRSVDW